VRDQADGNISIDRSSGEKLLYGTVQYKLEIMPVGDKGT
jgi:hypothetical protein